MDIFRISDHENFDLDISVYFVKCKIIMLLYKRQCYTGLRHGGGGEGGSRGMNAWNVNEEWATDRE